MDLSSRVNFWRRLCVCTAPTCSDWHWHPLAHYRSQILAAMQLLGQKTKTKLVAGVLKQDQNTPSRVKKNVFISQYKMCVHFQWKHLAKQQTVHTLTNDDANEFDQLAFGGDDCRRMPEWIWCGCEMGVMSLQDYQNIHLFSSDIRMCTGICLDDVPFITVCSVLINRRSTTINHV